jgi:hypothetical protein
MDQVLKRCSKCKLNKPMSDFGISRTRLDGINPRCKACSRKSVRDTQKKDPKKCYDSQKAWKKNNPVKAWATSSISHHRRYYKVAFDSTWLVELARATTICPLCGTDLNYQRGNGYKKNNTPSLDRTDNEQILTKTNVMIICYNCNRAKSNRTLIDFVKYCKTIYDKYRHVLEENEETFQL